MIQEAEKHQGLPAPLDQAEQEISRPRETALVGIPRHDSLAGARSFASTYRSHLLMLIGGLILLQKRGGE